MNLIVWLVFFGLLAIGIVLFVLWVIDLILRALAPLHISAIDLFIFLKDLSVSMNQLQKNYDWNISQWSTFANTVLTATLSFAAACVLEYFKNSISRPHLGIVAAAGISVSVALYVKCQSEITRLRSEFEGLHSLLMFLK